MQTAAIPPNEQARVAALYAYDVLDTLPERAYDDIVFIASKICDTPIALVSLVDAKRQWFKARRGIDATQTSRAISFCSHALLTSDELLIVDDAARDSRFADNPLVLQQPKIRFYAGAPLVTCEGHALGTLCVLDTKPRQLNEGQKEMLRGLSRQVIAQLELRRTVAELERRNTQLSRSRDALADLCRIHEGQRALVERDLQRAKIIQHSLLPHQAPDFENCYLQSLYRPGHTIGGDFYDVKRINSRELVVVVADAAGHGVSAAMLSVLFKHYLHLGDRLHDDLGRPAAVLSRINALLHAEQSSPGLFVTAVYCLVDVESRCLKIASAGHLPVICIRSDGSCETIAHTGPALGLEAAATYEQAQVPLQQGDRLLMYTDGLLDLAERGARTAREIAKTLHGIGHHERALEKLLTKVSSGRERRDRDDITLVLLNLTSGQSRFDESGGDVTLTVINEDTRNEISYADTDEDRYFCLTGRLAWMNGQTLFDHALSAIDAGRGVVFDFSGCTLLDSTLLGTLHELVVRAEAAGVRIRIQSVLLQLVSAFEELSMQRVINCIVKQPLPVPKERHTLDLLDVSFSQQQARLLKAHEVLAELSEHGQAEFGSLIATLRSEMSAN